MQDTQPDPGSFRDPLSRLHREGAKILRGLKSEALEDFDFTEATGFWKRVQDDGRVVGTRRHPEPAGMEGQNWAGWLEHDPVAVMSYPYEWSFEMLKDAAILQLDLIGEGLADGVMCKDASPFNILFDGSRPVFVDVGSFERYRDGDPWYGFQQFRQLFLNPLLFQAYKDVPFQPWLKGDINGIPTPVASKVLGGLKRQWKGMWSYVLVPSVLEQKLSGTERDVKSDLRSAGFNKDLILANVEKLAKLLPHVEWKASDSVWSNYSERGHYTDDDLTRKSTFVEKVTKITRRRLVWDIGCNDGHFSRIAASNSDLVVAFDGDHLVIDTLYKVLRREARTDILPLVMDVASPAPGLGWRGRERLPFVERARPDLVLALAVIHHIAITSLVPIGEFVDFLADMGTEVVLEFPLPSDPMVKRLLRNKREGVHDDYNQDELERHVGRRFRVATREELPSGTRILYHLIPR